MRSDSTAIDTTSTIAGQGVYDRGVIFFSRNVPKEGGHMLLHVTKEDYEPV